ncbi:MAG TPA: phosphoglycerate mutase family protein [Terriglobales bacterium]|nr:phosphoglycerate mutase family protein [Terriglobales bacterium]
MKVLANLLLVLVCVSAVAQEGGKIFVVRHAEKQSEAADSLLSDKGRARAQCLAQTLADAHIKTAIVTQYVRTKETAAPLVSVGNAKDVVVQAKATDEVAAKAKDAAQIGNVLIVGHSNTLPQILASLGVPGIKIPDTAYDQLFVVPVKDPKNFIIIHYCPSLPSDATPHSPNSMAK